MRYSQFFTYNLKRIEKLRTYFGVQRIYLFSFDIRFSYFLIRFAIFGFTFFFASIKIDGLFCSSSSLLKIASLFLKFLLDDFWLLVLNNGKCIGAGNRLSRHNLFYAFYKLFSYCFSRHN